jgi:hypothetical protein
MRKAWLALIVLLAALTPGSASADGFGILGAAPSVEAAPYRYVALAPSSRPRLTVVERLELGDATVDRWWHLRGSWYVPAVAYDLSPGGLSADGGTLVLTSFPRSYPPRVTRLAVLDTRLQLRHPRRGKERPHHAITRLSLPGAFSFDAVSPDGSRIYLIQSFYDRRRLTHYEVRALDTASGRLLPGPIVDPEEPEERMQGLPITRLSSLNGRWAYTLYDGGGKEPFLHALDTVRGQAVCVDLPQLDGLRDPFLLRLRLGGDGRKVLVYSRSRHQGGRPSPPRLEIDAKSFQISRAQPEATASAGVAAMPWLAIGALLAAVATAVGWRRRPAR